MPSAVTAAPTRTSWWRGRVAGELMRLGFSLGIGALFMLTVASIGTMAEAEPGTIHTTPWLVPVAVGTLVAACVLQLYRHRWPYLVALAVVALSGPTGTASGAAMLVVASVATRREWWRLLGLFVPWVGAGLVGEWVMSLHGLDDNWSSQVMWAVVYVACVAVGAYIGERREVIATLQAQNEALEREQELREVQARLGERNRIAREMHDVLAHRISLVAMHSGALAYRTDLPPEQVAQTAELIRSNAELALTELRGVLGVMRGESKGGDGIEPPQPTLAALDELVRTSGATVRVQVTGPLDAVPAALSRHAYRIVQECLTNARKHAHGELVDLTVTAAPAHGRWWVGAGTGGGVLQIECRNAVPRHAAGPLVPGARMGLIGLTERAVVAGGQLTHGVDRGGAFVVRAEFPWSA